MADEAARNVRLDQLQVAAQAWADAQTKALNADAANLTAILQGRTGSTSLAQATVTATSALVVTDIDAFLTGE